MPARGERRPSLPWGGPPLLRGLRALPGGVTPLAPRARRASGMRKAPCRQSEEVCQKSPDGNISLTPYRGTEATPTGRMSQRPGLTIGQLAARCGVGVETIRFYERQGLLAQPGRPAHGYRRYPASSIERVLFLQRAKGLGFSLKEIAELLALRDEEASDCASIRERAASKVAMLEQRIASLQALREELETLVAACDGKGSLQDCRILRALSPGDPPPDPSEDPP